MAATFSLLAAAAAAGQPGRAQPLSVTSALPAGLSSRAPLRFVMVPKVGHPWFEQVRQGALAAAAMLRAQTGRAVSIEELSPAEATIPLQQQMLRRHFRSGGRPASCCLTQPLDRRFGVCACAPSGCCPYAA